jgi:NADH:ubiquinone oxidoreductase subunit 6 (subunit J)
MNFANALFWIIAVLTGLSAVMVVLTQNIVRAAVWLLFTLVGTCGVYFLLGADFVGATQLIVYVGGTLVLVVFGVMLTAQGPFVSMRAGVGEWAGVTVVGLTFFGLLAATTALAAWKIKPPAPEDVATSTSTVQLGAAFLGITDPQQRQITGVPAREEKDGETRTVWPLYEVSKNDPDVKFYRDGKQVDPPNRGPEKVAYLLPFEIVSVHLTVVLIGAAYLARAKRRREATA